MAAYMKPPSRSAGGGLGVGDEDSKGAAKGFVVRDAPWNAPGNKVRSDAINEAMCWLARIFTLLGLYTTLHSGNQSKRSLHYIVEIKEEIYEFLQKV